MKTCKYKNVFKRCQIIFWDRGDDRREVCSSCNDVMRGHAYRNARTIALCNANHTCQKIGCSSTTKLECHHKRPISWGGNNSQANLIILCQDHHIEAHEYLGLPIR